MTSLDLALDIVQLAALFALSIANGLIAYSVFKIQKDRNTPKLVVDMELVAEEDREYAGLYIQNVGLVLSIPMPALRAVQGKVTAEPALHVYAHGEACRPDEGRIDIGAGCPVLSMVRESYGCIIGDAPTGGAPVW